MLSVDEPDTSSVSAYWEDDNTLSAAVNTSSDVYIVEVSFIAQQKSVDSHITFAVD